MGREPSAKKPPCRILTTLKAYYPGPEKPHSAINVYTQKAGKLAGFLLFYHSPTDFFTRGAKYAKTLYIHSPTVAKTLDI